MSDDETLARFFNQRKNRFRRGPPRAATPKAFEPSPRHGYRLSLCMILGRSPGAIASLAREALGEWPHGWAELEAEEFRAQGLEVTRDDVGYLGHANATGFPTEDAPESEARRLEIQMALARAARVVLPEDWETDGVRERPAGT